MNLIELWHKSATTSLGLFWMAFWAFGLGYVVSSIIQVFVTRERMRRSMGETGLNSVGLGAFFGFISSSCSFAALATTRSLFTKGAGLVPSLAFLLASTNLVIELGIVISMFLSWQFVVGEYAGGVLLILLMWIIVRFTNPQNLVRAARDRARKNEVLREDDVADWKRLITSREGWRKVATRYVMEWAMVWKDVAVGFTVAGIIAAFVPKAFFQALFVGSNTSSPTFWEVAAQCLVGPLAAFFTFIGSMGNIPLAAVLFGNGVSFAGVMAFIFSDLIVFPVLRIQAKYYGWKMSLYILCVFLAALVSTALIMHYGFKVAGILPDPSSARNVAEREFFAVDYTLFLNVVFALMSLGFLIWKVSASGMKMSGSDQLSERILFWMAMAAFLWLGGGAIIPPLVGGS